MSDYNGWTNRETWLVNLHFGDYFQEVAEDGQQLMADYIEQTVWDLFDEADIPPFFADMINLGIVNWRELSEHYVTEEQEQEGAA
jgi:hypothetical protein